MERSHIPSSLRILIMTAIVEVEESSSSSSLVAVGFSDPSPPALPPVPSPRIILVRAVSSGMVTAMAATLPWKEVKDTFFFHIHTHTHTHTHRDHL